ncbi:MAG: hypothetical protein ACREP8_07085 [Candidatus Binatia bacterium]
MAVINYLATISESPEQLAEFYRRFLKTDGEVGPDDYEGQP